MVIISSNTFFGVKDLNEEQRNQNAICCFSHCKIMIITKDYFLLYSECTTSSSERILKSYVEKLKDQCCFKIKKKLKKFDEITRTSITFLESIDPTLA
jgi:hypothetical protein